MIKICMVLDGIYPQDIRVRKEAEALVTADKEVVVLCPLRKGDKTHEIINGVRVVRIGSNYNLKKKGAFDIIGSILNVNPLFYFGLKSFLKVNKIDYLHVHDLPLAGTAYLFRKKIQHALVLDLHENYPEALKTWFSWKRNKLIRLKNSVFMNPKQWSRKEKRYCEKYDKVICVVDEMKEKLVSNFDIQKDKLVVISNQEKKTFVNNFNENVSQDIIDDNSFSITYVGGFGPHRGLDTAINAMPMILKEIPNAKLFLVGKGSIDVEYKLREIVEQNNLSGFVEFIGYRPFNEVASIMKDSKLNIIPHKANTHTNNTIPHKLFQIMLSKSLLMVSSCKPLRRIVEMYDAGLVFNQDDQIDFARVAIHAYHNYNTLQEKTKNAFQAVMQHENWEQESKKLIALYDKLAN